MVRHAAMIMSTTALAAAASPNAKVPTVPTIDVATAAALSAIHHCAAEGQLVSAAIVGAEGEVRVVLRGDGAPPHSVEAARRKAYTAASFEQSTEALATLLVAHPDAAGLARLDGTLFVGGGLPLIVEARTIGGVGVSGSKGPGFDERCARIAVEQLTRTKP